MHHRTGFTTTTLHSDRCGVVEHGAVHQPMHPSAQYAFKDVRDLVAVFQGKAGFSYARQGTPTTAALEHKITRMEGGRASISFASGMAALSALFLTLLRQGDHLISSQYVFGNTNSLFSTLRHLGIDVTLVDATDLAHVQAQWTPQTRMVFTEAIANPGTQVADLRGMGQWCRERGLLYVLDNTLATPWLARGRNFDAGLVVNSLSKMFGGHANALGGAITDTGLYDWSAYPNIDPAYRQGDPAAWGLTQIKKKGLRDMGGALSSDAAHRIAVGMETLALRMDRASANAMALARYLQQHPKVVDVRYPGLSTHAQHARAADYYQGRFGTLLGVTLHDSIDVFAFLNRLRVLALATHLGDTRSLVLPVAHTIYHEMGPKNRALMGIPDNLLRISVGIEDVDDLLGDFSQALDAA